MKDLTGNAVLLFLGRSFFPFRLMQFGPGSSDDLLRAFDRSYGNGTCLGNIFLELVIRHPRQLASLVGKCLSAPSLARVGTRAAGGPALPRFPTPFSLAPFANLPARRSSSIN